MHPPSERSGQKAETAARRGGLAARADLPTPQETPPIPAAAPIRNLLDPSRKNRAARVRRAAPENAAAPDLSAVGRWSPHRVSNRGNLPPRLRVEYFGPWKIWAEMEPNLRWSGRLDLNQRLLGPEAVGLLMRIRQAFESCGRDGLAREYVIHKGSEREDMGGGSSDARIDGLRFVKNLAI